MSYYADDTVTVHHGDCLDVLATLPDASVDAVVTDPPYGLEFMGKAWDKPDWRSTGGFAAGGSERFANSPALPSFSRQTSENRLCRTCKGSERGKDRKGFTRCRCETPNFPERDTGGQRRAGQAMQAWPHAWAAECLRVLKPGGHLLAFGGSRTYHRLTCAVEDSGFEIRDCVTWHFGSGFPKSLNVTDALGRIVPADARCVCGQRSTQTAQDSPDGYPASRGSGGEPPPPAQGNGRAPVPSLDDARERTHSDPRADGPGAAPANSGPDVTTAHPSSGGSSRPSPSPSTDSPAADSAQSDTSSNRSSAAWMAGRSTESRIPHTSDSVGGSASSSLSQYPNLPHCRTCGGVDIPPGLGTALKPATEFIVVARKPLSGTVAGNVLAHGTGALNVDGCRVGRREGDRTDYGLSNGAPAGIGYHGLDGRTPYDGSAGRWPANVVLDESQAAALDQQSGERPGAVSNGSKTTEGLNGSSTFKIHEREQTPGRGDSGGASRFFYTAKADAKERVRSDAPCEIHGIRRCTICPPALAVAHPTVKPLALMRWLVRLVCPPGGVVLEPFAGSGTTVEACILEGFRCVAIEREADYLPLILQRIHRRRDPVAAVLATAEDGGLFDLLGEEPA